MTIKELREKRARCTEQASAILDVATAENRALNEEESRQFDGWMAEADNLKAQLDRVERLEAEKRSLNESRGRQTFTSSSTDTELRRYLLGQENPGSQGMTFQLRAQSHTGSEGGYTVADEPMAALERAFKVFGGVRQVARILRTSTGADLPLPTMNDTSNVASIIGENTSLGSGPDLTFGQVTLKAFKYSSGIILVPFELLQDASVNVGQLVGEALGERIARGTSLHFTTGDNTGKPQGVTAASAGKTGGTLGQISYAELVDTLHSVDAAYRRNAVWMFNDQTLAYIRKIVDGNTRALIWNNAQSIANGVEPTLLGHRYIVNNDMPSLDTANAKPILFGDFDAGYIVRDVQDVQIIRMNERYADSGQVGFVGISRHDGRLVNAGTSPIKAFQNAAA